MIKRVAAILKTWWIRMRCRHSSGWVVVSISYDGDTRAKCPQCGKRITVPIDR